MQNIHSFGRRQMSKSDNYIANEIDAMVLKHLKYLALVEDNIDEVTKAEWRLSGLCNGCGGNDHIMVGTIYHNCQICHEDRLSRSKRGYHGR